MPGRHDAVVAIGTLGSGGQMSRKIRWDECREAAAETEIVEHEWECAPHVLRMPALAERLVAEADAEDTGRGGGA
jgi:hypothetical protein